MSQERIRVVIADDDPLLRELLTLSLSNEMDLEVCAEAEGGEEALEAVRTHRPAVLLLDLQMPDLSGFEVLKRLDVETRPRILMLTAARDEDVELHAARLGAHGFISKARARKILANAIRRVASGETWFSGRTVGRILEDYQETVRTTRSAGGPLSVLGDREREVLGGIARGLSNQQIADELFMSVPTVKTHVRNILRKLNLANRTEAAAFAIREGSVS